MQDLTPTGPHLLLRVALVVDVEDPFDRPSPAHAWCLSLARSVIGQGLGGALWGIGNDFTEIRAVTDRAAVPTLRLQAELQEGRGDFLDDLFHFRVRRMKRCLIVRASPLDRVRKNLRLGRVAQMTAVCVIVG